MKKKCLTLLFLFSFAASLAACGNKVDNTKELEAYKTSMDLFFNNLSSIDKEINAIDPDDQNSCSDLLKSFDKLEAEFTKLSELTVPTQNVPQTFGYISELSKQASDYMTQANDYMKDAFQDSAYNENVYDAGMECYKRANKRVQFIVSLLHGEYPQDESISYAK